MSHRAVIYIRVSTEEQGEGHSPEAQRAACRRRAEAESLTITEEYADIGVSGTTDQRPALQRLLADIRRARRRAPISALIVDHTDRLSRNLRILLTITDELHQLGVQLVTSSGRVDIDSDTDMMRLQLEGMFAEQYIRNLRRETRKGLRQKASEGKWVGGISPYGYERVDKDTIQPASDESPEAVQLIFALYASKRFSLVQLADAMNADADRWGRTFGVEAIRDILRNRSYCGYVSSGGEEFPGRHEPLISEALWEECAAVRDARRRNRTAAHVRGPATTLLIGGLGRCHLCGQALWTSHSGRGSCQATAYYRCAGHSRRTCDAPQQPAALIDQQLLALVADFSLAAEYHADALADLQASAAPPPAQPATDPDVIQAKIDRLSRVYVAGNISDAAYETEITALKRQLAEAAAPPPAAEALALDLEHAAAMLVSVRLVLEHATIEEQRELMQMLFDSVEVSERQVQAIAPKTMYAVLLEATRRTHRNNKRGSRQSGKRALLPLSTTWLTVPLIHASVHPPLYGRSS